MPCINSRLEPLIAHQIKSSAILYFHLFIYNPLLCISLRTLTHESFLSLLTLSQILSLLLKHWPSTILSSSSANHTVCVTPANSAISAFKTVSTLNPSSFLPHHHNLNPTIAPGKIPSMKCSYLK